MLLRGAYDRPGEKVSPGVPAALPPLPAGVPNNRLGFAEWLVDPANPLPARVAVNRYWQMYFGTGLVKTVEDFGSQGEWPSHPGTAGLAGHRIHPHGLGREGHAEDDRDERDVPAVFAGDAGAAAEGSGEPAAGARPARAACRPRWCATRRWPSPACWWKRLAGRR